MTIANDMSQDQRAIPASLTECRDLAAIVLDEIRSISDQLDAARQRIAQGDAVDMGWYVSASCAKRYRKDFLTKLHRHIEDARGREALAQAAAKRETKARNAAANVEAARIAAERRLNNGDQAGREAEAKVKAAAAFIRDTAPELVDGFYEAMRNVERVICAGGEAA